MAVLTKTTTTHNSSIARISPLQVAYRCHVSDRGYYSFVRQLVESTTERPLSARKSRRTAGGGTGSPGALTSSPGPGPAPATASAQPAAAEAGEGGAAAADATADAAAATAAAAGTPQPTQSAGAGAGQNPSSAPAAGHSPGPRRDAESLLINFRLAVSFVFNVLVHEGAKWGGEEVAAWGEQLAAMMRAADAATLRGWLLHLQARFSEHSCGRTHILFCSTDLWPTGTEGVAA